MNIACVDLFCGVGGLTHGLLESGIDVRAGFDIDAGCEFPYTANNNSSFFCEDVSSISGEKINKILHGANFSILAGCAPCQPFSTNTSKLCKGEQHKAWPLLNEFGRLVMEVQPDVVTMENVPRLIQYEVFENFKNLLTENGYHLTITKDAYCPNFGIPQHRHRLVLLASKYGKIEELEQTHVCGEFVTVRQIIGNLPPIVAGGQDDHDPLHTSSRLSEKNMKRISLSEPGGSWREWPKELVADCHKKYSGRFYSSVYGRMKWDEPAPTITTKFNGFGNGRFGHPDQNRALSLREGAMLQTFPESYKFLRPNEVPAFGKVGRWIGNAVPPKLGVAIGKQIISHLKNLKTRNF